MRKFSSLCLALGLPVALGLPAALDFSALLGASDVCAASAAIIPGPPLPPAHVSGRVIDPHKPAQPLPARHAAPQQRHAQPSAAVPASGTARTGRGTHPAQGQGGAVASPAGAASAAPAASPSAHSAGRGSAAGAPAGAASSTSSSATASPATASSATSSAVANSSAANASAAGMPPTAAPQATSPSLEMQAYTAWQQQNFSEARRIWEEMAAAGHGGAMNNLGILWDKGQGVQEDAARAAQWFCKSAKAGHHGGMNNCARMLEQGRGVKKQTAKAAQWFAKAAQAGLPEAQFNLGVLYERGAGVKKNMKTAAQWYGKAAAAQQVEAQSRLARMYSEGRGVKKDVARATALAYGAAMTGDADSIALLRTLAARGPKRPAADFFGLPLAATGRAAMRKALAAAHMRPVRESDGYMCDVYDSASSVSGSREMAVCYASEGEQALAFVKLEYTVADAAAADAIRDMATGRYGQPSAGAGTAAALWNLGDVVVATQHVPAEHSLSLMFMVPKVYHLTQH